MGGSKVEVKTKSKGGFKKGNEYYKKRMEKYEEVGSDASKSIPEPIREPSTRLQEKREVIEFNDQTHEYLICKKEKMDFLWNQGFKEHSKFKKNCVGPLFLKKRGQLIISSTYSLSCEHCEWEGDGIKLYEEYITDDRDTRGRKQSTLNDSLAFALLSSPIGATGIHEIFLQIGIDPGSKAGLSKLITRCGERAADLGENVLSETRANLKRNFASEISASCDTRFNNRMLSANTPFTGGTQSVTTAIEEVSGDRNIVAVVTATKIGNENKQPNSKCKSKDPTIVLDKQDNIGCEGLYSEKIADILEKDDMSLKTCTTDMDCTISGGIKKKNRNKNCLFQSDTFHYSQSQWRKTKNAQLSDQMFMNVNKRLKKKHMTFFATELRVRCNAEFNAAHRKVKKTCTNHTDLKNGMTTILKNVPAAIVSCYSGKHTKCKKHSLVCGQHGYGLWEKKSLPAELREKMNLTASDRKTILDLGKLRLGEKGVAQTFLNTNTQKCEAVNRKLCKTNPKNITSPVNFVPRVMTTVIETNLGYAGARRRMLTSTKHRVCGAVKKRIKAHSDDQLRMRRYKKTPLERKKRIDKKCRLIELYQNKVKSSQKGRTKGYDTYSKEVGIDNNPN